MENTTLGDLYDEKNKRYKDTPVSPELPNYYNDALRVATPFWCFI